MGAAFAPAAFIAAGNLTFNLQLSTNTYVIGDSSFLETFAKLQKVSIGGQHEKACVFS
jgi:hypothetical protein